MTLTKNADVSVLQEGSILVHR